MYIKIGQQVALDEALVPYASRLRIGKSNFRLRSYLKSKESTLQVVYDVLKLTPFCKAFLVTADVPAIYMQEFWATTTVHHHSIHFNMNNKKHIVNLEYFREMMQICPRIPNQPFDELPFEEEILAFLRELGHSGEIKMITDVNINKLHQPWRSFAAVINKCLSGKSKGYDSICLSQAQILCGMYHKKNVDFAYLLWEDFVYQVEHKDAKKSNEMYYPRFTKVIVNNFMTKDKSIPKRNKVNWYFAMDDHMFIMIKLVSRHQNTQQYGAILPVELTNEAIRNSESYKEYYAIASGAEPPKTKASVRKKQSSSDTTVPPPTAKGKRLKTSAKVDKPIKEKQPAKSSKAKGLIMLSEVALTEAEQMKLATKRSLTQTHISQANKSGADEGTGIIPGVLDVPTYESDDEEISWKSSEKDDDVKLSEHDEDVDDQSDDDSQDYQDDEDDQDNQADQDDQDEDNDQDDDDDQTDLDNDDDDFVHSKFSTHDEEDKDEESFDHIVQTPSQVENTDDEGNDDDSHGMNVEGDQGPNAEDDDNELYGDVNINLEGRDIQMADVQTTQEIEDTYVTLTLVNPDGQQQSSSVSSQFVSNMLNPSSDTGIDSIFDSTPWVEVPITTTVEPPLLSAITLPSPSIPIISHGQQTPSPSPANAPSSSPQELLNFGSLFRLRDEAQAENEDFLNKLDENIQKIIKEQVKEQVKVQASKILPKIKKTVNEQLEAKVLTRSSNSSKTSYAVAANLSELVLKKILIEKMESNKRRDDEHKDEEPSAGSNRGSKRSRAGKELELTNAPKEKTSKIAGKSSEGSKSHHNTASDNLAKKADSRTSFNELMDTPVDFSAFVMNRLKVDTLTPELLAGPTYELMKGSCKSLVELKFFLEEVYKATTDQLDWNNPEGQQYPHDLLKPLPLIPNSRGRRVIPFNHFINNDIEYLRGGIFSRKYTTSVTKTMAADYGHNFKRLHIQDIEDMLLLLNVHKKHRHPTACGRSLIRCQKLPKEAQPDKAGYVEIRSQMQGSLYRSLQSQRFIYQNKDKQNGLMRIDELHKFSNDTLNDVRTALDDRLKRIRMKYMPQIIWRRSDKDRATTMIQAIDKQQKTRRIMRSLEKFVDGRLYEGDFRMLQRTI
uniref:Uncharacterized protein n=1 Tax=Tanacetum cinerariifolium TaxID=118510 RepID=A0A6L2NAC2_TANCI|nr:hypothetical protein [Tanacetum cinerariifolium]